MHVESNVKQRIHQIPLRTLFASFPELRHIWNPLHRKWQHLCQNPQWTQIFSKSQDAEQRKYFFDTQSVPDMEHYQRLELLNEGQIEAKELIDGWILNRGKIAYPKLVWSSSFEQRGVFWYPKGGFREWHSNFPYNEQTDKAGWRIYLVDVVEEGKSGFQYLNREGEVVHCADRKGHANIFWLPEDRFFWHSVFSHTDRFSCGFLPFPHISHLLTDFVCSNAFGSLEDF